MLFSGKAYDNVIEIQDRSRALRLRFDVRNSSRVACRALRRLAPGLKTLRLEIIGLRTGVTDSDADNAELLAVLQAVDRLPGLTTLIIENSRIKTRARPPFDFQHLRGLKMLRLRHMNDLGETLITNNAATLEEVHCGARCAAVAARLCGPQLRELRLFMDTVPSALRTHLRPTRHLRVASLVFEAAGAAQLQRAADAIAALAPFSADVVHLRVRDDCGMLGSAPFRLRQLRDALGTVGTRIQALTLRLAGPAAAHVTSHFASSVLRRVRAVRVLSLDTRAVGVWLAAVADRASAPALRRIVFVSTEPLAVPAEVTFRMLRPDVRVETVSGLPQW